jgi:hypothetical protein
MTPLALKPGRTAAARRLTLSCIEFLVCTTSGLASEEDEAALAKYQ